VAGLRSWDELPLAGVVTPDAAQPHTGGWRTGVRPEVDLALCVDCLLCWLHCPDAAVVPDGAAFGRIELDFCKGCEICAVVCPTGAIEMVPDE
jgi:2-oxoacid:acceptor oxidoreductase delta subunit (pyruvate/2-ketoisovalerate family)